MPQDAVFLLHGEAMTVLTQSPFQQEAILQQALARFPSLIAGPTTVGDTEPGLLLIKREMGIPKADGGSTAFSIDHLFIDADAVPVLVEVKRSTDTRIRREVIGQMLDYVANGVAFWPVSQLRAALETSSATQPTATGNVRTADEIVSELSELDAEEFWSRVEQNLRAGRVRLLFVADELPPELVRVIEFLNEQMSPAEVLGVELRQYVGKSPGAPDHTVLVPRVVGRTSDAVAKKVRATGGQLWSRDSFLDRASSICGAAEFALVKSVVTDAENRGVSLHWGRGSTPSVGAFESVAAQQTRVWMIQVGNGTTADPLRLELEFRRVATRLSNAGLSVERLEQAATTFAKIGTTIGKLDDARKAGWLYAPQFAVSTLTGDPANVNVVTETLSLFADPVVEGPNQE